MASEMQQNRPSLILRILARFGIAPMTVPAVTDDPRHAWDSYFSRHPAYPNEEKPYTRTENYQAALIAWRTNPLAKQIISLMTDFLVTEEVVPTAPTEMGKFIYEFWTHEENRMQTRLPDLMDEQSRAGDLFLALFRNEFTGMSYVRPVPASEIVHIEVNPTDWEDEIAFYQKMPTVDDPTNVRKWLSPSHPDAQEAQAVMVHYTINRPIGALFGESELASILSWLKRYSRMLEDRVRLNNAAAAFVWSVTVPTGRVGEKSQQYASSVTPGSVIVHDEQETWEILSARLNAADARHDLKALRMMIAAGSGQPPFWHADAGDVNLATARVMQEPAMRRLLRRQQQFREMAIDLCHIAYSRYYGWKGRGRMKPDRQAIKMELADLTREDNKDLAGATKDLVQAFMALLDHSTEPSETLSAIMLDRIFKFSGQDLTAEQLEAILSETEFTYAQIYNQQQEAEEPVDDDDQEGSDEDEDTDESEPESATAKAIKEAFPSYPKELHKQRSANGYTPADLN